MRNFWYYRLFARFLIIKPSWVSLTLDIYLPLLINDQKKNPPASMLSLGRHLDPNIDLGEGGIDFKRICTKGEKILVMVCE